MDNPEKLTSHDEEKQNKTTQYVLDTTMRKQTQISYRKSLFYLRKFIG